MTLKKDKPLESHRFYECVLTDGGRALLFTWKEASEATVHDYMDAIRKIAKYSREHRPALIVVDKRKRRVELKFDHSWWRSEILPMYHEAGIAGFAHVTGNPEATGETPNAPEGLRFKMGEFKDIESALRWPLEPARPTPDTPSRS